MAGRLRIPAEGEPHARCWLAYPHLETEWPDALDAAQRTVADLCRTIADEGDEPVRLRPEPGDEPVRLLVRDGALGAKARSQIGESAQVDYAVARYGDCWTRDTLPVFGHADGRLGSILFRFNGWGGKFVMDGDESIGAWVAEERNAATFAVDLVLEGGALEFDGRDTCIVTESCALNPNRNPDTTRASFEEKLRSGVDVKRFVWLSHGLPHDHTDGHVDMVARFVSAGAVMCAKAGEQEPNAAALNQIEAELETQGLSPIPLPSPGRIAAPDGTPLPANYCNFYVANAAVIVPQYDVAQDAEALACLAEAFPGRAAIGLPALDLLRGGGSFHCVTQPEPRLP